MAYGLHRDTTGVGGEGGVAGGWWRGRGGAEVEVELKGLTSNT